MKPVTVLEAIDQALTEEMAHDPRVILMGEGVATKRKALVAEFGADRVRNTPLAEGIIAGTAVGAAATGLRPVIDLLFAPFLCYAMDELVNSAGKLRYLSGGQFAFPLVAIAMTGAGWGVGAQHNHNIEAWFVHTPGLKVVMPSSAADFKSLLKAAIRDDNPVLFFVDIGLAYTEGELPAQEAAVRLGEAAVRRIGEDVTLISYAKTVGVCERAAAVLAEEGVSAEVLDLRTLKPLDEAAVLASVRRTGRAVVVHEASRNCGVGAEIAAMLTEQTWATLKGPVLRVGGPDAPAPASYPLEQAYVPQVEDVVSSVRRLTRSAAAA